MQRITQCLKESVNNRYLEYYHCEGDKRRLENLKNAIALYIYRYPVTVSHCYEELCGEFWQRTVGRIPSYIQNFVYRAVPFEQYLSVTIRYQFITFLQRSIRRTKENRLYTNHHALYTVAPWIEHQSRMKRQQNKPEVDMIDRLVSFAHTCNLSEAMVRRLWWQVLCYSSILSKKRIVEIGEQIGLRKKTVLCALGLLAGDIARLEQRLGVLESKCNEYFAKRNLMDRELRDDVLTREERNKVEEKRREYSSKYYKAVAKLQTHSYTIPHSRLSTILNIPKGTIDSGISLLRKYFRTMRDEAKAFGVL